MIRSMTAYGRAFGEFSGGRVTFEMKSVNNRHLDCQVKLPRRYICLEEKIKSKIVESGIYRGKVDVYMDVRANEKEVSAVTLNTEYAEAYIGALKELRDKYALLDDISVMSVAQRSDIFNIEVPEEDAEAAWLEFEPVLDEAISAFIAARETEGERLAADIKNKLSLLREKREELLKRSEIIVSEYKEKLEEKLRTTLKEIGSEPDESRVLTECAIFADRVAIDEELVRLASHFDGFEKLCEGAEEGGVGRNMDFLLQEMNREVNTSGSKISDIEGTRTVVEMKGILEKIREQIQNIE